MRVFAAIAVGSAILAAVVLWATASGGGAESSDHDGVTSGDALADDRPSDRDASAPRPTQGQAGAKERDPAHGPSAARGQRPRLPDTSGSTPAAPAPLPSDEELYDAINATPEERAKAKEVDRRFLESMKGATPAEGSAAHDARWKELIAIFGRDRAEMLYEMRSRDADDFMERVGPKIVPSPPGPTEADDGAAP